MNKMKIASYIILIVSVLAILCNSYCLYTIFSTFIWTSYNVQTNKRGRGGKKRRAFHRLLVKSL